MSNDALIPVQNLQHKVVAIAARDPQTSLTALAEHYFRQLTLRVHDALHLASAAGGSSMSTIWPAS